MAKNKLSDLNDHLFMALERLNDEDLTSEKLEFECNRVKAMSKISTEIIKASDLFFKVAIEIGKGNIDSLDVPEHLKTKKLNA